MQKVALVVGDPFVMRASAKSSNQPRNLRAALDWTEAVGGAHYVIADPAIKTFFLACPNLKCFFLLQADDD